LGYICACRGDELIGFVNLAWDGGSHAFVLDTTVHPNFCRRGVGRRLVKLAVEVVRRALEAEGLPTPGGRRYWSQMFVRSAVLDDVYRPHAYQELKALLSPEVAIRLDPDRGYGIYWYNRRRNTYR
jgi:hypothetical protein